MLAVNVYRVRNSRKLALPLFLSRISCGFPSPADDYIHKALDLNEYLIRKPSATFFVRAEGDSMQGAGIRSGDILIVDRSLEPQNGSVVLAIVAGEFTVKRLRLTQGGMVLEAENGLYSPIQFSEGSPDLEICGVVTFSIHRQTL